MEWTIPGTDIVLTNVHDPGKCAGEHCVVHNPSNHHMKDLPLHWRNDRGIFERICTHGIGHPDPDQHDYWRMLGLEHEGIHGCDGCCADPERVPALQHVQGPSQGGQSAIHFHE